MTEEIHDHSRVDAFMAARRRAMVLHSLWRPTLAGAAGAALVIAAVYVTLPKISYREIEVPRVTLRDVEVPNIVPKNVEVDRILPHEVPIEIPQIVITRTPQERAFADSRDFADAPMHGRIVASRGERSLSFDDGHDYVPTDPRMAADAAPFVGDLGLCSKIAGDEEHYHCVALHNGVVVSVRQRPLGRPT
jgi:hypothetical protein